MTLLWGGERKRKAKNCYEQEHVKILQQNSARVDVTKNEFGAYLGILLLSGKRVHTKDLWKTTSHPIYRAGITFRRF